jgi:hypothetical protein
MLMKGKTMKKTKRRNTLLLSRVAYLFKGKQKNTMFCVLQQGCSFSPFLEVFVNNCMETILEAEEGKYLSLQKNSAFNGMSTVNYFLTLH